MMEDYKLGSIDDIVFLTDSVVSGIGIPCNYLLDVEDEKG